MTDPGTILREAREREGLSLRDLENVTGVSRTTICDYESGKFLPSPKSLKRLQPALVLTDKQVSDMLSQREKAKKRRPALITLDDVAALQQVITSSGPMSLPDVFDLFRQRLAARN